MKKHPCSFLLIGILPWLLLGIIGPLLINLAYQIGPGYETVWTGADALSYFGSFLSVALTAWTLYATIHFTRCQITAENALRMHLETLDQIEAQVNRVLEAIHPLLLDQFLAESGKNGQQGFFLNLFLFRTQAQLQLDHLRSVIPNTEAVSHGKQPNILLNPEGTESPLQPLLDKATEIFRQDLKIRDSIICTYAQETENLDAASDPQEIQQVREQLRTAWEEQEAYIYALHKGLYSELLKEKTIVFQELRSSACQNCDSFLLH